MTGKLIIYGATGYTGQLVSKILKPAGVRDLIPSEGVIMEHAKFSFDSTTELAKGTELEISISPIE
jgi:hypothetical protein